MNVTATLFGQMITFFVLIWFVNRFLWGPLTQMMQERNKRIADGLAAGEKGKRELALAEERKQEVLRETKGQAAEILAQAEKRSQQVVEEAKDHAKAEADRILEGARADITQEINRAKEQLRTSVAQLALAGAAKIVEKEIDAKTHERLLNNVINQL